MTTDVSHLREELKELKRVVNEESKKIHELEMAIQRLEIGHKSNIDCIIHNREDIEEIKDRPNKREDMIASCVLSGIVATVVAFVSDILTR